MVPVAASAEQFGNLSDSTETETPHAKVLTWVVVCVALALLALGLLGVAIAGVSAVQTNLFWETVTTTAGVSFIASSILWVAQALLVNRAQDDLVRRTVSDEMQRVEAQTLTKIAAALDIFGVQARLERESLIDMIWRSDELFKPAWRYEDSERDDPKFNQDLQADFRESKMYLFRGVGGAKTAVRLASDGIRLSTIDILLPDPRASAFESRVTYETTLERNSGKSREELKVAMKEQILLAFVGLHESRFLSNFTVHFVTTPFEYRFEICDEAAYVTPYLPRKHGAQHGERGDTMRFANSSFCYQILNAAARHAGSDAIEVSMLKDLSEAALARHIYDLQLVPHSGNKERDLEMLVARIPIIVEEFKAYRDKKADSLGARQ